MKRFKLEQIIGKEVSYKGQKFIIRHDAISGMGGYYITALENGRVAKGWGQWVSERFMKECLE